MNYDGSGQLKNNIKKKLCKLFMDITNIASEHEMWMHLHIMGESALMMNGIKNEPFWFIQNFTIGF